MSAVVRIPAFLADLTAGERIVAVEALTVGAVVSSLDEAHPGVAERLLDDSGLRRYVNIYVNRTDIRVADGLATPVADGDEVTILPVAAGG